MQTYDLGYSPGMESQADARLAFIRRTYAHLAGAIVAFVGIEAALLYTIDPKDVLGLFATRFSWLFVMLAFMGAGWLANYWARSESSPALQYLGLSLYVVSEAVIFLPILLIASNGLEGLGRVPHYQSSLIPTAGILTLMVAGGLTLSVFISRRDYSFLGPILSVGAFISLGFIVAAIIFGFNIGTIFSFAMVALMSGYILYETSMVMLHFRTDQHVAAALMLFASVATLFFYILRILMAFNSRD